MYAKCLVKESFDGRRANTPCPKKDCTLFLFYFFFLGAQCVESGVSCTDCY